MPLPIVTKETVDGMRATTTVKSMREVLVDCHYQNPLLCNWMMEVIQEHREKFGEESAKNAGQCLTFMFYTLQRQAEINDLEGA